MKFNQLVAVLFAFQSCTSPKTKLIELGEVRFRNSFNFGRDLSDAEIDSIGALMPESSGVNTSGLLHKLLIKKGFITNNRLDTTLKMFQLVTWEKPSALFGDTQILLDTSAGTESTVLLHDGSKFRTPFQQTTLGDVFVSFQDIEDNPGGEMLVLRKYYFMSGENFDLKAYKLR